MSSGVCGAAGGLLALALDLALAQVGKNSGPIPSGVIVAVYLGVGIGAGIAVRLLWGRLRGKWELCAGAFSLMYLLPVFDRVQAEVALDSGKLIAGLAGVGAAAVYLSWVVFCAAAAGRSQQAWGLMVGASTAAVVLAANRNLLVAATDGLALMCDVGIGLIALILVWLLRRFHIAVAATAVLSMIVFGFGFSGMLASSRTAGVPDITKPNIVLLVVDTLRADVFDRVFDGTSEGSALKQALDSGVRFSRAYSTSPWTAPSMGSMMTGLYPHEHGFGSPSGRPSRPLRRLADSAPTLAEKLHRRGFSTMAIGANTMLHQASGIDRGFESYTVLKSASERLPLTSALVNWRILELEPYQQAEAVFKEFAHQLGRNGGGRRPYFAWLHFMDPHAPLADHPELAPDAQTRDLPRLDRLYHDEVRSVMGVIRSIIDLLKERGDWEETIFVITSDHGEMLPSDQHLAHFRDRKGRPRLYGHGHALFEELVRIPLLVHTPWLRAGFGSNEALVSVVDYPATLSWLVGAEYGERSESQGFAGALGWAGGVDRRPAGRNCVLMGWTRRGHEQYGGRMASLKIIAFPDDPGLNRVFDLSTDPREQDDQSGLGRPETEDLMEAIESLRSAAGGAVNSPTADFDASSLDRLKALGYVDSGSGSPDQR